MRHKHADLIHAWAEGAEIQYRASYCGDEKWHDVDRPAFSYSGDYRIKPAQKPDVVRQYLTYADGSVEMCTDKNGGCHQDTLRLTFSGETGELIRAEVLK